ncbi:AP endonuclease [Haloechinothrix sp. YIM 98757]|uniref:AP endonuclease n=2 Tax=Haloechinothrix aidingensis TaxID=2752311 RepID=A0A838ADH0_9PSEU|nr:AP endonuclease [Haloechinothrix aidingensis]
MHLRAGPRGYDLARRDTSTLRHWARVATHTIPVTGLTCDVDLVDLLRSDPDSTAQTTALTAAARVLGCQWIRVLARTPPERLPEPVYLPPEVHTNHPITVLIELHHPNWLLASSLELLRRILDNGPHLRLLIDTGQIHRGQRLHPDDSVAVDQLLAAAKVLHLSDDGTGLDGIGHVDTAECAVRHIDTGHNLEVAFEWTGRDRSPAQCLHRYRSALQWWQHRHQQVTNG